MRASHSNTVSDIVRQPPLTLLIVGSLAGLYQALGLADHDTHHGALTSPNSGCRAGVCSHGTSCPSACGRASTGAGGQASVPRVGLGFTQT